MTAAKNQVLMILVGDKGNLGKGFIFCRFSDNLNKLFLINKISTVYEIKD